MKSHIMTEAERRARWDRIVAKQRRAGQPVEQAPVFLAWIEAWIAGTIDMRLVQRRYVDWQAAGRPETPTVGPTPVDAFVAEISREIPGISGLRVRDPQSRLHSSKAISSAWEPE